MLISAVTEETRRYLFNAYEPFNFDFVLKKTLVITTNLTNPESAPGLFNKRIFHRCFLLFLNYSVLCMFLICIVNRNTEEEITSSKSNL